MQVKLGVKNVKAGQAHEPAVVLEGIKTRPVPAQEQLVIVKGIVVY